MQKIPLAILNLQEDGYHILVDVQLFGQPFKMVVDTGASKTVLDKTTLLHSGISEDKFQDTHILSTGLGTNSMQSFIFNQLYISLYTSLSQHHRLCFVKFSLYVHLFYR